MASNKPGWYKYAMIASLYVGLYMVFIGEQYLVKMIEVEKALNENFFSEDVAAKAESRGSRWFKASFVDTYIMAHSFEPFIPTEEEMRNAKGMEGFGKPIFDWFEGRMRAWWTLVWSAYVRLSTALLWAPYAIFMLTPWSVDGLVEREKAKYTFKFASPVKHRYALMALGILPLLFLILITAPIAMHPMVMPLLLLGAGFLMCQGLANFMKRA